MKIMQHLAAGNDPLVYVGQLEYTATSPATEDFAHGLTDHIGNPVTPSIVHIVPVDKAASFAVTAIDETKVTIFFSTSALDFHLWVG